MTTTTVPYPEQRRPAAPRPQPYLADPAGDGIPDGCVRNERDRDQLFADNLGLVGGFLRRLPPWVNQDPDILQEARLGLLRACELWNPDRGTAFSTYAYAAIRSYVVRWRKIDRLIHVPVETRPGLEAEVEQAGRIATLARRCGKPDLDIAEPEESDVSDDTDAVRLAMSRLSWDDQDFLRRRLWLGESTREMASREGCGRQTIRVRQGQVLRRLKAAMTRPTLYDSLEAV